MSPRRLISCCLFVVGALMARASDISGVYTAGGMTIRASIGMPSTYVSLCDLLSRDTDPARHEALVKQEQDVQFN
jgi:hypothetical protein